MGALFLKLVNMSITASWLALAVMIVRFLLRKTPKWIVCLLWGLVALRLVCPFTIESALSLVPSTEPLSQEVLYTAEPEFPAGAIAVSAEADPTPEVYVPPAETASASPVWTPSLVLSWIWVLGMGSMLLYALGSYLLLKRRVAAAIPMEKGVKQCEYVDSPFVLGIFRPVVYLPFGMEEGDMAYVLAHERAHIRRHDHWWKPFGFLLLSVYWFNPVMWAAYILLCRDIEAACDEKVIRNMETDDRRAYSTALLNCSVHRRRIAACPLAFGEVEVKVRIKSVMNYKKPAFWVIITALLIGIAVAVCFLTDPKGPGEVYAATSTVRLEDVEQAQAVIGEEQAQLLLTEEQTQELVTILNGLQKSEFKAGTVGTCEKSVTVSLDETELLLSWDGAGTAFSASGSEEKTAWVVDDIGLNAFFDSIVRPDWGIRVSVKDVLMEQAASAEDVPLAQATMVFSQNGMELDGSLSLAWEYELQVKSDGSWTDVYTRGFPLFTAAAATIPRNGSVEQKIFFADNYYDLAPGQYRIVKYVTLRHDSGYEEVCPYYGEFSIVEGTAPEEETAMGIVCVDVIFRNVGACLSLEEEYAPVLSLLEEIEENAQTVPEDSVADQVYGGWFNHYISICYAESKQEFFLSKDCTLLWTEAADGGRQVYSLDGFLQLQECLMKVTGGVNREATSGTPFASKDEPWNWTKNISSSEVEQASLYLQYYTFQDGDYSGARVSSGTFASERFGEMLGLLNAIPADSFTKGTQLYNYNPTYSFLRSHFGNRGISVSIIDRVNSLAVVFIYDGGGVKMAMCDDLEKVEKDQYLDDALTYWNVNDWALTQYMQDLMEDPPLVSYYVGSGFMWEDPVEYTFGDYSLSLALVEGWECEVTEVSPDAESFGVRCRPGGVSDGWLYFSFWPGGYELQEENRCFGDGFWMGYSSTTSYPDQTSTGYAGERNTIWSFYRARTERGDFAAINEGADDWFVENEEAIDDIISMCRISVGG